MLALLKSRKKLTRGELAKVLEVTPREISRYKEDLQMAGIEIIETRGRYGGYELVGNDYLLELCLSHEEKVAFNQAVDLLKGQGFIYTKELMMVMTKMLGAQKEKNIKEPGVEAKSNLVICNYKEEKEKWARINEARIFSKKLRLLYMNANREVSERIVHPYTIYAYKEANYLVAYCENRQAVRQFKFIRIQGIERIEESFEIDKCFDSNKYLSKSIGMYKDEIIDIKLKVFYPYAQYFKETQWVEQEEVEDYPEEGYKTHQHTDERSRG